MQMKNIVIKDMHVQYMCPCLQVCECVCLSLSLHFFFLVVYLPWINLDYYLSEAALFQFLKRAKADSNNKDLDHNLNPAARHKRKKKKRKKAYLPYHRHTDLLFIY